MEEERLSMRLYDVRSELFAGGAVAVAYGWSSSAAWHRGNGSLQPAMASPSYYADHHSLRSSLAPRQRLLAAASAAIISGPSMPHMLGGQQGSLFLRRQFNPGFRSAALDALWTACHGADRIPTGQQASKLQVATGAEDAARSEGTPSCQARRQRTEDEAGSGNDANDDTLHGSTRQMPDGSSARTAAGLPHKVFAELQTRQLEVEMLLRLQLSSEEDIAAALRRVSQALRFEEELDELATSRDVLKGRLFQAMLESQCVRRAADVVVAEAATEPLEGPRAPPSKGDGSEPSVESQQPPLIGNADFGLTSVEWAELVEKANDLCELIKIKVQDDNDLKTARAGLSMCKGFLDTLIRSAEQLGSGFTAFDVYQLLLRDG